MKSLKNIEKSYLSIKTTEIFNSSVTGLAISYKNTINKEKIESIDQGSLSLIKGLMKTMPILKLNLKDINLPNTTNHASHSSHTSHASHSRHH
jgi:hypothetical protein